MAEPDFSKADAKTGKKRANNKLDNMFVGGKMDKYFKVTERGSNLTTEIRAGCTTYLTAAYIMAVNPNILSVTGLNFEGLVFATAMSSFIATLIMALWANLPFGLWPGMGMNAYFAYTIVGFMGTSHAVKKVMFAVFIEGLVFIVMSLLDLRRQIFKVFPTWLMKSSMAGIGLFLAHIGLQAGNGIDLTRGHPAILVDLSPFTAEHASHTILGVCFFLLMATLVMLRVKGAVMIGILLSTFTCWILAAAGNEKFTFQPMCCLGSVSYPSVTTKDFFPKPGGDTTLDSIGMPKPTCGTATLTAFKVEGSVSTSKTTVDGDDIYSSVWTGSSVVINGKDDYVITAPDGTVTNHLGPLLYEGNGDGRNSLGNKGGCNEACHGFSGGFNPACFGSILISTSCWSGMSFVDVGDQDKEILESLGASSYPDRGKYGPYVKIDGFGEGCIGGAGRIPKTFDAPTQIVAAPKAALAKELLPPWPGWFACDSNGQNCFAGAVKGGTFWAFDTDDLSFEDFGGPLITLLYVDFLGTMAFLYAAADLTGLIDPKKPDDFPGCYAAFMADAIGTTVGGLLGTSSVTTYGESMAGVYEGGRTGLTALTIAFLNFLSMFFAPFFSSVPTISTGPALIMVGVFMIEGVKDIDWTDYMQAIPSMLCILLQPVTYKIEFGVMAGLVTWAFMMIFSWRIALYIPPLWRASPKFLQNFVARQPLDAKSKAKLEALTGSSGVVASA